MPELPSDPLQAAIACARNGQFDEAQKRCESLINQPELKTEARHLLGVIFNIQQRYAEAEPLLRQSIAEQPGIAKYHSNLGNTLYGLDRFEEAEACYRQALALDPTFADARSNLLELLNTMRRWDELIPEYQQSIRDNPRDLSSHVRLAHVLQLNNRLQEAEQVAAQGLNLDPSSPSLNLVMAFCENQTGRREQALQRMENIPLDKVNLREAAALHYERGLIYDRLNRIEPAWVDFVEANRLHEKDSGRGSDRLRFLAELDRTASLDISWYVYRAGKALTPPAPVFLVGFPRSGTTLLDQILDSHPRIQTLEEQPLVNILQLEIERLCEGHLGRLSGAQVQQLRNLYFEHLGNFIELRPGNLLVDKLPLNIGRIPYILRVFPDARFILALRHPCDCVLSCYMHLFEPNDAMANFSTLPNAAALYAKVMGMWRNWAESLPLRQHRVYYEHLVQDLQGEIGPLLDFLGLEWQENMARPHEHAAQRGFIKTPSRTQVLQPIYQRASGRWRRYETYLNDVMPDLLPYIRYFGYDT